MADYNIKNKLLETDKVIDNEWLDKYVELIESNRNRKLERCKTQSHHIVPECCFYKRGLKENNSKECKVNLLYIDHVFAHFYLYKCSKDKNFSYANAYSIFMLLKLVDLDKINSIDDIELINKDKLQSMYQECLVEISKACGNRFKGKHQSKEHIAKRVLKNTGQTRSEETKNKMSAWQKGKPKSEKARENMSKAQKEYAKRETLEHKEQRIRKTRETLMNRTEEEKRITSEKLSKKLRGRVQSKEEREKHSKALKGKPKSAEHRNNLSKARSKYIYTYKGIDFYGVKKLIEFFKEQNIQISRHIIEKLIASDDMNLWNQYGLDEKFTRRLNIKE